MTQQTESEEYEFILGHSGQLKYYVKIAGQPYSRSKWITKDALLSSSNGSELLQRYKNSSKQRSSAPFYDKEYDIPDHIILKDGNSYLIKWNHLFHDNLTWEDKIDKSLLNLYKSRKSAQFPSKINENMQFHNINFLSIKKLTVFHDYNAEPDIFEEAQFIFRSFENQDEVTIQEVDNGNRSILTVSTLITLLLKKCSDAGPYLIVVEQNDFDQWYDILNKSSDITTLAYNGSSKSRETIREIDFVDSNDNLTFQVLLTVPAILESDIEILKEIDWKICISHLNQDFLSRLRNTLKVFKKITFIPIDEKEAHKTIQLIHHVAESDMFKDQLDEKNHEEFNQLISKQKMSAINKIENTFFFVVECPMNDMQKYVCKNILYESLSKSFENKERPNFGRILRLFYYVMQHPFLIPNIESQFEGQNFIYLSTKMRVLRKIISNVQIEFERAPTEQNILVCTQIHQVYQLLIDFANSICIDHINLFIFEANTAQSIPFNSVHTAIIYDGSISYWKQFISPQLSSNSNVYKLEVLDCRENETPTENNEEDICKTIALQLLIPSGKISTNQLLDENISLDLIQSDPCHSSFASNFFTDESFWTHLYEMIHDDPSILEPMKPLTQFELIKKSKKDKKNSKQIQIEIEDQTNLRHRHQFIRSFMSFGWGNWESIIESSGMNIDIDACINLALQFIYMMKNANKYFQDNFISDIFIDFCLQKEFDNSESNFDDLLESIFLNEECFDFNERVLEHACLNFVFGNDQYTSNDIDAFDFAHLDKTKPDIWWTNEHDKALLYSIYRNGYGNYINIYMNDIKQIEESSKSELFQRLQKTLNEIVQTDLSIQVLNNRQRELLDFIASYVLNDLRHSTNDLNQLYDSNWTNEEQQTIISFVLRFGIDLNNPKEFEEAVARLSKETDSESERKLIDKSEEQISAFLEFLKSEINNPTPETGLSIFTALKIRAHIASVTFLHKLIPFIDETHYISFFSHLPIWKLPDDVMISAELEALFLTGIEKYGFGMISKILENPKFSAITDPTVITYMNDEYRIMLRIDEIQQIEQKNDLFSPQNNAGENKFLIKFGLQLPLALNTTCFVENFGVIHPDLPNFHQERYLFPIGFKTSRLSISLKDSGKRVKWYSEIVKEGDYPLFRVWQDGMFEQAFEGSTATGAWTAALKKAKRNKNVSVSGPDMFLLTHPVVRYFLQKMPGANLCKNYIMKKEDSNPIVVQFLSERNADKS